MKLSKLGVVVGSLLLLASAPTTIAQSAQQPTGYGAGPCHLAQPAFCDTFDSPTNNSVNVRVGDLNGTVWGASRMGGSVPAQGQADAYSAVRMDGTCPNASAFDPQDIKICGGVLFEASNDRGGLDGFDMYPKQPFDFAGRAGLVTFDMTDDTQGTHASWPVFQLTDQPVPAPHPNGIEPAFPQLDLPQNEIGVSFAGACDNNCPGPNYPPGGQSPNGVPDCFTVDEIWTSTNHTFHETSIFSNTELHNTGCVRMSSAGGSLNHVAIQFQQASPQIIVFASDPTDSATSSTQLREIAEADNLSLPLTRGLIWIGDSHYNGCKENTPGCQSQHTYAWDNVGFDGPTLPRDLTYDVPDNHVSLGVDPEGQPSWDIGWTLQANQSLSLLAPSVQGIQNAVGALLTFNYNNVSDSQLSISINGNPSKTVSLVSNGYYGTIAVPINLSDLQPGDNIISFSNTSVISLANIDIILQGAGGVNGTPVPTTSTPTPTLTNTPVSTPTATSTSTTVPTNTPIPTSTSTVVATSTATPVPTGSTITQLISLPSGASASFVCNQENPQTCTLTIQTP